MTGEIVFDGARLRATLFNGDAPRLFVSLRQRIDADGAFDSAQPVRAFTGHGFAHLHLQSRLNDWFVNDETGALEEALARLSARYEDARGIGFSMGGYGLLRFARALRLGTAVLVSPQVSIHPDVVPWDRRYRRHAAGFDPVLGDLAQHGSPAIEGVVLFDPFRPLDRRNARMICDLHPGLRPARLACGGHPATRVIGQAGAFGRLQTMLREGGITSAEVTGLHRGLRRESPLYWRHLSEIAARRGHDALADAASARHAALIAPAPPNPA